MRKELKYPWNESMGKRLRRLREIAGLKQKDVAFQCGLSRPVIALFESGGRDSMLLYQLTSLAPIFKFASATSLLKHLNGEIGERAEGLTHQEMQVLHLYQTGDVEGMLSVVLEMVRSKHDTETK